MLSQPTYIPANLSAAPLDFDWSNAIAVGFDDADDLPPRLTRAVMAINYKSQMAVALACLEWVFWRLHGHTDITDPLQRIEAAWASTLNLAYTRSLDFDDLRKERARKGNPEGPRQTALSRLDTLHYTYGASETLMATEASKCAALASHVLPTGCGFDAWLTSALGKLASACPHPSSYNYSDDTYDHSAEPPIPRAWFESPDVPLDASASRAAWDMFLRNLESATNPYLVPADEMRAAGFAGEPYRMA